ncbi:pyruvate dehydrogenase complex dihydrolipoamide acetyltransferase [Candidatus Nucleicultrix amoebiphila]|uniref:Acetyltransferase component of pyruvate dehydrogenase complex n=1 Tax=Candidatus Nucleicultrix amoebiphila FS5 TaxID=1414854 RepID=A0A1W6N3K4_9PROT|nr:pyruvate dehydrogenase complex dihydrolipoamide acetyltransferase [Candidatus Nucleicultrix amoebiphila]ARN84425.1 branched-chain alpha-keto acid dehydrogenase subunit E2 [Candidatus Nucleicultrix amoebiphila FS5]
MPIKILMPALSPTMTEGNLVRWLKKEGDKVSPGDLLAEIETDKATMEVEAVDSGNLAKIYVAAGSENVKVNDLIAVLLEEGEDASALKNIKIETAKPIAASAPKPTSTPSAPVNQAVAQEIVQPQRSQHSERVFASPLARRVAEQKGISLNTVQGTGPKGRIVKADVEKSTGKSIPQSKISRIPQGPIIASDGMFPAYEEVKLSNMRKVIAQRLTESKQNVPHFYLSVDCEIDALLEARQEINEDLEKEARISVNDFIIKACAKALTQVPEANATWGERHIKIFQSADISMAVAIDGGLVTPIIREAHNKSLFEISTEAKQLIVKARAGKLTPQEFQGGTFSISNLGMYGIKDFSAVINPPQGCILAVGAGEKRPIVNKNGQIEVGTVMTCTLSVDHRVVDGAVAAEFLQALKKLISTPVLIFI